MQLLDNNIQTLIKEVNSLKERVTYLEQENVSLTNELYELMNKTDKEQWHHPQSSHNLEELWKNSSH
jgi:regulator of replication initiation timing|tara:strand:- start:436 stop:636 length:201 start_codon:yes stop_codon:yes gene_type:complete